MTLVPSSGDSLVDQSGVSAGHDVIGRDKHETHNHFHPGANGGVVDQLLKKLEHEIESNVHVRQTIESLAYYYNRRSHDGVDGLQAKLQASGRESEYLVALEKKELFAKLLEKWSLYASAQQILAYLLAKAEHEFNSAIHPQITSLDKLGVNQLVTDKIVSPIVAECGSTLFAVNHGTAMGMVYWLAEQCYVRWHA